jgi:hypothetical protein
MKPKMRKMISFVRRQEHGESGEKGKNRIGKLMSPN